MGFKDIRACQSVFHNSSVVLWPEKEQKEQLLADNSGFHGVRLFYWC